MSCVVGFCAGGDRGFADRDDDGELAGHTSGAGQSGKEFEGGGVTLDQGSPTFLPL